MSAVSSPIPIRVWRWNGSTMGNHYPPVTGTERPATLDSPRWTCSRYMPRILAPIPARPPIDWDRRRARSISTWNVSSRGWNRDEDHPRGFSTLCKSLSQWRRRSIVIVYFNVRNYSNFHDCFITQTWILFVLQHQNDLKSYFCEI